MYKQIFIAIIVFIAAIIIVNPIGGDPQVIIGDIPDSENGDVIRGQSWIDNESGRCVVIYVDCAFVDDYGAIVCHEYGHAAGYDDEASCDENAHKNGYDIQDKYSGVH